jgi:hypothetical protein
MRKPPTRTQRSRSLDGRLLAAVTAGNGTITKKGPIPTGPGPVGVVDDAELTSVVGGNGMITKLGPRGPGPAPSFVDP